MEWVQSTIRGIGGFIDKAIYSVVEVIMQLIMDLSNVEIFSQSVIDEFATRIYIILGLVMVFKMMVSFIQILVNPDKMDDKEQGVTGVLKRAVISLVLIFMVPSIFDLARQVQGYVLPVIPRVILGANVDASNQNEVDETMSRVGQMMAFYSFLPFFTYDNPQCDDGSIMGPMNDTSDYSIWSVSTAVDNLDKKAPECSTDDNEYKYKYSWPLSSIVGIYLLFVLIQVAIAIAIRAIKLGICEFVAPIPIASYIDPKSSKQAFDTWVKTSVQVYLDLFIRLIVVYFVVFIFMTILNGENLSIIYSKLGGDVGRGALVTLFIIVGLLQFVKQAPKFICDILGFKGSGDIAGMFKGAWGMARETGGLAANLVKAPISNAIEMRNTRYADGSKPSFGRVVGSALAGMGAVTGHTIRNKLTGKSGKDLTKTAFATTTERRNQRIATKNRRLNDYTWMDEKLESMRRRMNISSTDEWAETAYSEHSTLANIASKAGSLGLKKGDEQDYRISTKLDPTKGVGAALGGRSEMSFSALQRIMNMREGDTWTDDSGTTHRLTASAIDDAGARVKMQQKANKIDFFGQLLRDRDTSAVEIQNEYVDYFKNSPIYNSQENIDRMANSLFGNNDSIQLERVSFDDKGNKVISTQTYDRDDFSKDTLIEMAQYNLSDANVLKSFKDVGENLRNEAQVRAADAKRRNQARKDASKS